MTIDLDETLKMFKQRPADVKRWFAEGMASNPKSRTPAGLDAVSYWAGWLDGAADVKLSLQRTGNSNRREPNPEIGQ